MPHHLRSDEVCEYREGLTTRTRKGKDSFMGTMVDCGLQEQVLVPLELASGTRVTVKLGERNDDNGQLVVKAEAVSPDAPREESGYYWGYNVRQSSSLSNIFTECQYDGGYDRCIGTSERGVPATSLIDRDSEYYVEPAWKHLLIVFGGIAGLEAALSADRTLLDAGVNDVRDLFDRWVNLVPGQGSRTIRTEEAIWVGLTDLRRLVERRTAN